MVQNLAHVFYRDGSQGLFRKELTRRKWLFYRIRPHLKTHPAYFKVNIMRPKGLETVYINTRVKHER